MRLNPPRVPEILAGAFAALLGLSLFLPWYRAAEPSTVGCAREEASCPRETVTGFEAFAVLDIFLLVVAAGAVALLLLEMTQRTAAVPVAWSALMAPLVVVAAGLVLWRTLDPPGEAADEPVFALLGLAASIGLTVAVLLSMRSESPGWRTSAHGAGAGRTPDPLSVSPVAGDGPREGHR